MPPKWSSRRPPWWSENEPWPPSGPPWRGAWFSHRSRFFRRIGSLIFLLFLIACLGFSLLTWLVADFFGWVNVSPARLALLGPLAGVALIVIILGAFRIGYALRHTVAPVGDLIEAANRAADGDYTVRVAESGPREVSSLAHTFNGMMQRLQTNDEMRRRLLADITHELRTPLTILQGNVEGLIDGVYPADEAHLRSLLEETRVMSRLINDLRTLSLVESGSLQLQTEPVDLDELLRGASGAFQAQAESAGVDLRVDVQTGLPEVSADAERLRALVENLIANAMRYTPPGGKIQIQGYAEEGERVAVSVRDTGRGIAPEDLEHIFDRFYKSSDSRGMGLGLAIAKGLIEAHGGEIKAESKLGEGTTIIFTLPIG